jgi:hypothetical protein
VNPSGYYLPYKSTSKNSIKMNSIKYGEFLLLQRTLSSFSRKGVKGIVLRELVVALIRKRLLVVAVEEMIKIANLPKPPAKKLHKRDTSNLK